MKKLLSIMILAGACIMVPVISFAQDQDEMGRHTMGEGRGSHKMSSMPDMMRMVMPKQMVATSDGGIIVLVGKKLLKYDKDLNLIKEVEIEIEMKRTPEAIKQMKEKYQMYKKTDDEAGEGENLE